MEQNKTKLQLNATKFMAGIKKWEPAALAIAVNYACPLWPTLSDAEKEQLPLDKALGGLAWECENQAAQRGSDTVELRDALACTKFAEADAKRILAESGIDMD